MQAILFPTTSPAPVSSAGKAAGGKSDGQRFLDVLAGVAATEKAPPAENPETSESAAPAETEAVSEETIVSEVEASDSAPPAEDPETAAALVASVLATVTTTPVPTTTETDLVTAPQAIDVTAVEGAEAVLTESAPTEEAIPMAKMGTTPGEGATPIVAPVAGEETVAPAVAAGTKPAAPAASAPAPTDGVDVAPPQPVSAAAEVQAAPAATATAAKAATEPLRADPIAAALSATVLKSTAKPADLSVGMRRFQIAEAKSAATAAEATETVDNADTASEDAPVEPRLSLPVIERAARARPGSTPSGLPVAEAPTPPAPIHATAQSEGTSPPPMNTQSSPGVGSGGVPEAAPATAAMAASPGDAPELHGVADQALRHVRLLAHGEGSQSIRLRLVPETLGELHMEVHRQGDTITVRMASANPAVRDALESQAQQIQHSLQKDGVSTVRVEISTGLHTNADAGGRAQEQAQHARAQQTTRGYSPPRDTGLPSNPSPTPRSAQHAGNLNLFI